MKRVILIVEVIIGEAESRLTNSTLIEELKPK
jgi:hypothetical protein